MFNGLIINIYGFYIGFISNLNMLNQTGFYNRL